MTKWPLIDELQTHPMKRVGSDVSPRVDGDNVLATYGANNIRIYTHSSGQTRLEATNWIRMRPLNGLLLVDVSGKNNLLWVYNSAQDDYVGTQAVFGYGGIISTNKYKLGIRSKTGEVRFDAPSVNNIIKIYDSSAALTVQLDTTAGHVSLLKDNASLILGAGSDAGIYYDGTNLNIDPKLVGAGICDVLGTLQTDGYNAADGSAGVSGSWTAGSGETITVKNGIVTGIA